ncbi:MAG: hypothetical protein PF483_04905 [Halothiobacillus sp.]|jgi:uncharacterized membrane protein|uniref:hypothetical protein n=1 Tax=Halothiobacillus sp. TaxID=1891311 RepID=UPI002AD548B5|nr:hypothetical protein [Halothiobacillus sp.]MDA3876407.1 hypothetical protein [Halothiobacillus sp.]
MNALRITAIALIVAGALGLAYGSFTYTKSTQEAKIGPISLSVKDNKTVNIPVWAGVGAMVLGGLLLAFGARKP